MANYRFPRPRREEDLKSLAASRMIEKGMRPSSLRTSESESVKDVVGKWNAAVAQEAQAIKESRDPKLRRKEQLTQRESAKAKAEKEFKKSGAKSDTETPESFWSDEPGLARTTYTERTGRKMEMPEGMAVGAVSREAATPDEGMIRQIAGSAGFGSTKMDKKAAEALAKRREEASKVTLDGQEWDKPLALAEMRRRGNELRMQREKAAGAESIAKREGWEADKRAFAEGQQIQREARKRLTRVNRALRGTPDFDEYGKRTAGYGDTMSADEFNALLEEQAALKNTLAARETLKNKGITRLGVQAEVGRRNRAQEAEQIRQANLDRILAAQTLASSYDPSNPYNVLAEQAWRAGLNLNGGFGLPSVNDTRGM